MGEMFKIIMIVCATIDVIFIIQVLTGSNRKQPDNVWFCFYALTGAIWSLFFGLIPTITEAETAFMVRSIGLLGTFGMFITSVFLFSCWTDYNPVIKTSLKIYGLVCLLIMPPVCRRDSVEFVMTDFGMSYHLTPNLGNTLYNFYCVGLLLIFLIFICNLLKRGKRSRERRMGIGLLAVLLAMAIGAVVDTLLPIFGFLAVPGSTIMQFVATVEVRVILFFSNKRRPTMETVSRQLFETQNFPILAFDRKKILSVVSEKADEMLHLNRKINTAVPLNEIFRLDGNPLDTITGYTVIESEILGSGIRVNLELNLMRDRFNEIDGYIVIIRDMTEHFRMLDNLNAERIKAEEANRSKTTFLANMSHEIRTPINTVLGMNEMIRRESISDNIKGYAGYIKNAGDALLSIINDILDFSKVEAGMMEIVCEKYSLRNLLIGLVEMFSLRSRAKGLDFRIVIDRNLPDGLYGDEIRIRQIMINLLSNAIKYTELGEITFSLKKVYQENGEIRLWFMVSDTGIGVKKENIDHLFSSFKRIEGEQTHHIEGTGLGLSIVRELAHLMKAELKVDSIYGEGSSFSFIIDQKVVDTEPIGSMNDPKTLMRQGTEAVHKSFRAPYARILVVDDNKMNLEVIKGLLKVTRVQLDTVLSGQECLEKIRSAKYDLIFLDHMMPVMDGIETFKTMRSRSHEDNLSYGAPVIILTANAIHGAREQYLDEGFTDYLSKPVDSKQLEDMIVKYLPPTLVSMDEEDGTKKSADAESEEMLEKTQALREALAEYKINLDRGLEYVKNIDIYRSSAETFALGLDECLVNLKKYRDEGRVDDYRILIHGMKTNARTLGKKRLFEYALEQENACKEGRFEDIVKDGDRPEVLFREFRDALVKVLGLTSSAPDEAELVDITPEEIQEKLAGIVEALAEYDADAALEHIEALRRSRIEESMRVELDRAYGLCRQYEYDEVAEIVKQFLEQG